MRFNCVFSFQGWGRGNDTVDALREMEKIPKPKQWGWPENTVLSYEREIVLFPVCRLLLIWRAAGVRGRGCVVQQWLSGSQEQQGEPGASRARSGCQGWDTKTISRMWLVIFTLQTAPKSEHFGKVRQRLGSHGSRDHVWRGKRSLWKRVKVPFKLSDNVAA